jgi:hypothetical protein
MVCLRVMRAARCPGHRAGIGQKDLFVVVAAERFDEDQVVVAGVLDVVAAVAFDEADVAGPEVGGVGVRPGVEHRHPGGAFQVVLPLVGVGVPVQLTDAAGLEVHVHAGDLIRDREVGLGDLAAQPPRCWRRGEMLRGPEERLGADVRARRGDDVGGLALQRRVARPAHLRAGWIPGGVGHAFRGQVRVTEGRGLVVRGWVFVRARARPRRRRLPRRGVRRPGRNSRPKPGDGTVSVVVMPLVVDLTACSHALPDGQWVLCSAI